MAKVIERVQAHYEVQDVEMGKVYRWCPETVVVECNCDEQLTLSAFKTTCPECGADHAPIVEEMLVESVRRTKAITPGVTYSPTRP